MLSWRRSDIDPIQRPLNQKGLLDDDLTRDLFAPLVVRLAIQPPKQQLGDNAGHHQFVA